MSSAAKAHEPSMEEILASIRRIISDDDPKSVKSAPKPAGQLEPDAAASDLGQDDIDAMFAAMDDAAPATSEPKPDTAPHAMPAAITRPVELEDDLDVLELTEEIEPAAPPPAAPPRVSAAPEPPLRAQEPSAAPAALPGPDRLLSADASDAVTNAFGSLAHTILAGNARTLDDIVRDMLRPMLRAWLDDNLPPLVERLVRQEIERVARGGR